MDPMIFRIAAVCAAVVVAVPSAGTADWRETDRRVSGARAPAKKEVAMPTIGRSVRLSMKAGGVVTGTVTEHAGDVISLSTPDGVVDVSMGEVAGMTYLLGDLPPGSSDPAPLSPTSLDASAAAVGSADAPSPLNDKQAVWRQELDREKSGRAVLMVFGIGGMIGGGVVLMKGWSENQSAQDVPGCTQSGTTVYCATQEQTDEAQAKIDGGLQKMAVGSIVMLAGAGLTLWGVAKGRRIQEMEARGRRSGFTLAPHLGPGGGVVVAYNHTF